MLREEEEFLLDELDSEPKPFGRAEKGYWRPLWAGYRWLVLYCILLHVLLVVSFTSNVASLRSGSWSEQPFVIFSELRKLRHEVQRDHVTNHTAFTAYSGHPTEDKVAAWQQLLQPLYFNASVEELQLAGADPATAVRVKDGGYIASLGVYHELHCLNKLRSFLYLPPDPTPEQQAAVVSTDHLDHCLELLRRSTMCNADLSFFTFSWPADPDARFLNPHSTSPKWCVNWEQVESYAWKRKIGLTPTLLKDVPDNSTR
ncbi:hypothetical protein EJ04DRAFT_569715 [Polyplosphaeria fusca]|uniref:Tat pathway signal sequence n=1 Tax=Polyplosphaeria fusca TaxID=682080 RepID=A0A9P4QJ24_9PLEO|nr:hypothetical protein EJ04DRAFT_569715 [Polyplosphaeria fusca]